jgi:hypothetical protein
MFQKIFFTPISPLQDEDLNLLNPAKRLYFEPIQSCRISEEPEEDLSKMFSTINN